MLSPVLPPSRRLAAGSLVAGLLLLAGCGSSQPVTHTRTTPLISIFEADVQLHAHPVPTLDLLHRLGVNAIRLYMPWGRLGSLAAISPDPQSPTPPAGFDPAQPADYPASNWQSFDTIIRDAQARGIAVDLLLGPEPPLWARGTGDPGHPPHPNWKPNAAEFGAFVAAVGTRYSGRYTPPGQASPLPRVSFWSLWNEPNYGPELAPQTRSHSTIEVSPSLYRGLLDAGWSALHATGHSSDTILIGELAPRGLSLPPGPLTFGYMVPLRFVRALYCVNGSLQQLQGSAATAVGCPATAAGAAAFPSQHPALFRATAVGLHPYPQGAPNRATPGEPDYADLAVLSRFEKTIDGIMHTYGSSRQYPIYSTEFGYQTDPPETLFNTVSPAIAAGYLNWSEYLTWRDPRIRSYDQYLLSDPPLGNFATGLEFADGKPKPGYEAYRMPLYLPVTTLRPGMATEVWGAVRPARYASSPGAVPRVRIQFRVTGTSAFKTVELVKLTGSIYFDVLHTFARAGQVRLAWTSSTGQTFFSRTVQLTRS